MSSWAEFQCENAVMELNGENIRNALGEILFLIRFPVMRLESFFETVHPKGILTPEEVAGISRSIALQGYSQLQMPIIDRLSTILNIRSLFDKFNLNYLNKKS